MNWQGKRAKTLPPSHSHPVTLSPSHPSPRITVPEHPDTLLPDPTWLRQFRQRLQAWFRRNARDLPWRRDRDPYAVWISEIMLQQTQVAAVKPYFERFLARLPTIAALAEADEEEVMRLWEGLGYYRRARQLHQAAQRIVAEHGGVFPRDPEAVRRLPGIGRYTAGAILSIAFDAREPILEANTLRLFSRLLAYRGVPTSTEGTRLLWSMAEAVLPRRATGLFNQALMELGSLVCLARTPRCDDCPAALLCRARAQRLETQLPPPKAKPRVESCREAAVVVLRRGRVLLRKRAHGERWAGLWDFPRFPVQAPRDADLKRELAENVERLTGVRIEPGERVTTIQHGVTRFRITLDCYRATYLSANKNGHNSELRWVRPAELHAYPLSTPGRRLSREIV